MFYKIVIIDDNPDDLLTIKSMLLKSSNNLKIIEFKSPKIALKEIKESIDCIIVNNNSPEMSGIEFIKEYNKSYSMETPIILTTSQGNKKIIYNNLIDAPEGIIGVIIDITNIKSRELELTELSYKDSLTKLFNRRYFDEIFPKESKRCMREKVPLSILMIDIDYFKNYNDEYGHQQGDECLKIVANTIQDSLLRPSDIAVRYGGEEFVVILPNTDKNGSIQVAQRIRENILEKQILHDKSITNKFITVSIGISQQILEKNDLTLDCLERADKALYIAKKNGRNIVEYFTEPKK